MSFRDALFLPVLFIFYLIELDDMDEADDYILTFLICLARSLCSDTGSIVLGLIQ